MTKFPAAAVAIAPWLLWLSTSYGAEFWLPINPQEVSMKTPLVEKDAAAEVLYWETKLENDLSGSGYATTVITNYLRIKIFTEKGRDAANVEIPFFGKMTVSNVDGRTIKPDGVIRPLKGDAIFDKDIVKSGGVKFRARTFVLPDVAPGDIIEYRYRQNYEGIYDYMRLPIQKTIPVEKAVFRVRPLSREYTSYGMRVQVFHAANTPFSRDRDGYFATNFENIRAYHEEPYMPPEDVVRAWMLVYYNEKSDLPADKFWIEHGKKIFSTTKPLMKADNDVKREAAKLIGDAQSPDDKLRKLYDFCQTQIKNTNLAGEVGVDDRKDLKVNHSPADTLRQGAGSGSNIDMLFAALAIAAGFDVRVSSTSDRSDFFLDPSFADGYFLNARNIAVRFDDKWRFFDPANRFLPYGMLRWQEDSVNALVSDSKQPEWIQVPRSASADSRIARKGKFTLQEDGTLEGDVELTYTGHEMVQRKQSHRQDSMQKREKEIEDALTHRLPGAEVTNIKIENVEGVKPLVYRYHVKVPGYAQRTGKRLFLQAGFFQRNTEPRFSASERVNPICFDFAWSEVDDLEFDFPPGYEVDHPDAPPPVSAGKVFDYQVNMGIRAKKTLIYHRQLAVDGIYFPAKIYASVKLLFDAQFKSDEHLLTFKQIAPPAGGLSQ